MIDLIHRRIDVLRLRTVVATRMTEVGLRANHRDQKEMFAKRRCNLHRMTMTMLLQLSSAVAHRDGRRGRSRPG